MSRRPVRLACLLTSLVMALASEAGAQTVPCAPGDLEVRSLQFAGNTAFTDGQLAQTIATTPSGWTRRALRLPFAERRCLNQSEFVNDRIRLIVFYRNRGYSRVAVDTATAKLGSRGVAVRFIVSEGPSTRLAVLAITGLAGVRDSARIARNLPIRVGEPFDRVRIEAARDSVARRLRNSGYAAAIVTNSFFEDRDALLAYDTLHVASGPFTRIGGVTVAVTPRAGRRQQIPDRVVRRIAGVNSGAVYRERDLLNAQRALYQTEGYRQVAITLDTIPGDSLADIRITLAEDAMRAARVGLGYGTLDCIRASGELTNYNFLRGARRLELSARVSKIGIGEPLDGARDLCPQAKSDPYSSRLNYYVGATLRQPSFFGLRTVPTITVYSGRTSEYKAYLRTTAIGGIVGLDWRRFQRTPVSFAYQLDYGRTEAQPALFCAVFNRCAQEDRERLQRLQPLGVASIVVSRNAANNPVYPTRGYTWRAEARHASKLTLADNSLGFNKILGDAARYWGIGARNVIAVRFRAGGLLGPSLGDPTRFVPPEERLFAGGPTTVRGFSQNELGSAIYIATQFDTLYPGVTGRADTLFRVAEGEREFRRAVPVGGNSLLVGNVELRVPAPVFSNLVQVTLFTDVGDVWNRGDDDVFQNFRLKATPGIQLGALSPVGLIRLVIGYNPYDRPAGPLYYEVPTALGGALPCVSPANELKVHAADGVNGLALEQEEGRCPGTFAPTRDSGVLGRLTFSFAIGQAF
ncbi:MAG TPA: BamA/TamA family outer membrane protein [Gemmatimonadaceae bacterium]|nr:BamA/TamA family outer membrane protein [Gemmatimonadaceae bacterium]